MVSLFDDSYNSSLSDVGNIEDDDNESEYQDSDSDDETPNAIIIDNGSGVIKAGFNFNDQPSIITPSIIKAQVICVYTN